MKKRFTVLASLLAVMALASCYHARIETGLTPSTRVIEKPFAASWIYGLVPPNVVKVARECPNGVAVVETKLSFVNQLVGWLTMGIYTPMHIKVTCASGRRMGYLEEMRDPQLSIPAGASDEEIVQVFEQAAKRAAETQQAVYVQFE